MAKQSLKRFTSLKRKRTEFTAWGATIVTTNKSAMTELDWHSFPITQWSIRSANQWLPLRRKRDSTSHWKWNRTNDEGTGESDFWSLLPRRRSRTALSGGSGLGFLLHWQKIAETNDAVNLAELPRVKHEFAFVIEGEKMDERLIYEAFVVGEIPSGYLWTDCGSVDRKMQD